MDRYPNSGNNNNNIWDTTDDDLRRKRKNKRQRKNGAGRRVATSTNGKMQQYPMVRNRVPDLQFIKSTEISLTLSMYLCWDNMIEKYVPLFTLEVMLYMVN